MSADNGIYILETLDRFIEKGEGYWENTFDNPVKAWRVAHVQGIDNIEYIENERPYMVGYVLMDMFGKSKVYYSIEDAYNRVKEMEKDYHYLEYGAGMIISRPQYDLS